MRQSAFFPFSPIRRRATNPNPHLFGSPRFPVNIWTHLFASVWFLAHGSAALFAQGPDGGDGLAVALYCGTTATCFLLSALFHTVADTSPGLRTAGHALDHLGIAAGLWGTGASTAHFALYCAPPGVRTAHGLLLAALAAVCAVWTRRRHRDPHDPQRRVGRLLLYAGLGAALFAPLAHAVLRAAADVEANDGYYYYYSSYHRGSTMPGTLEIALRRLNDQAGLRSFLVLAVVQLVGGAVYAARAPERWAPRVFDRFGQSHQLMHALVVVGAAVRLEGLLAAARYWRARDGSCSRPF